ncbi:MAG: hypothetical protein COY75_02165 [Nitrospirae bacterium CG_4_10_14_0_8_um_filter_41_23]|nr:hypothetical protein [Nitrospirota bacterium]PIQ95186.1 MAG: hypothetical protein COV68_00560 [Nitrospirae bacterium CG11_big_fil_rev_8_21_14_0_20_41_14]PIV41931.1 MAG: hypothetical protein COS27_08545 [Nitrospirae bacterium CG02_land_8_20_14_3_00_41_53]PIW87244.1 MAG: hypothetical protein COZ94_06170 [Nitrospirae bacterium CG_4_8_14_3_um_filter_41_47]PIY87550.1 MAG: hypothetical protein COY75_02165 [Nitrospirae bacterium CG_4_10_14_0_8_um_filter_41_23]PJA80966.1 MAG: hypothetical protein C
MMKVADLTKEEFRMLIGEVIEEKLRELLDPDFGLELREDFIVKLESSIASKERIPFEDVKKRLGLS